jgi:hypothetical protein
MLDTKTSCLGKPITGARCSGIYTSVAPKLLKMEWRVDCKRFRSVFEKVNIPTLWFYMQYDWQNVMKE